MKQVKINGHWLAIDDDDGPPDGDDGRSGITNGLSFRIAPKGGVSVYGLQRWPVTLYADQWHALLAQSERLLEYLAQHAAKLKGRTEA